LLEYYTLISIGCQIVPGISRVEFFLYDGIYAFAQNWMTSAEILQRTYLRFIEEEATAKRARAQIRPGDWSMVKRVGI
jgi:hypothetical protein